MGPTKKETRSRVWDTCMRFLVRTDPQAFLDWLFPGASYQSMRPEKSKLWEIEADAVIDAHYQEEELIVHLEAQTYHDSTMGFRLLQCNVLLVGEHTRSVRSYVLHLLNDGRLPRPPFYLEAPGPEGKQEIARFFYESIEMADLTPDDLFRFGHMALLALVPFTKGGVDFDIINRIYAIFQSKNDSSEAWKHTVLATSMFIELILGRTNQADLEEFQRRYKPMYENDPILETPLYQSIERRGFAKGMETGMKKGLEKGLTRGMTMGIEALRNAIIDITNTRFPNHTKIVSTYVKGIDKTEILQQLCVEVGCAQHEEQLVEALQRAVQQL